MIKSLFYIIMILVCLISTKIVILILLHKLLIFDIFINYQLEFRLKNIYIIIFNGILL